MSGIAMRCKAVVERDRCVAPVLESATAKDLKVEKLEDALYRAKECIADLRYKVRDLTEYRRQSYDYYNAEYMC